MENDFLDYSDTQFRFGYLSKDGDFIGTTVTGIGLTYQEGDFVLPIGGDVKSMTVSFEDTDFMGLSLLNSFTLVKLPSVKELAEQFDLGWFVPETIFKLSASIDGERMLGTDLNNRFVATDADDDFRGLAGQDILFGGLGNDALRGGDDADYLRGDEGEDLLIGGRGNDRLEGGADNDEIRGSGGDDEIDGGSGDDLLEGGAGSDLILGGLGNDTLKGGKGDDLLQGAQGNDRLEGGKGNDILQAVIGDDYLRGGQGKDVFLFTEQKEAAGSHFVRDFTLGEDRIGIQGAQYRDAEEVQSVFMEYASQVGNNVLYADANSGTTVTFLRTDLKSLEVSSFIQTDGWAVETL